LREKFDKNRKIWYFKIGGDEMIKKWAENYVKGVEALEKGEYELAGKLFLEAVLGASREDSIELKSHLIGDAAKWELRVLKKGDIDRAKGIEKAVMTVLNDPQILAADIM